MKIKFDEFVSKQFNGVKGTLYFDTKKGLLGDNTGILSDQQRKLKKLDKILFHHPDTDDYGANYFDKERKIIQKQIKINNKTNKSNNKTHKKKTKKSWFF
jgi:hypothetical protein